MRALLSLLAAGLAVVLAAPATALAAAPAAAIRVDQLGFAVNETKVAYVLETATRPALPFTVVDGAGTVVLSGTAGASRGRWNARYGAVQPLDLSALSAPGTYRIKVAGPPAAASPPFRIDSPAALFAARVADVVSFFQVRRRSARVRARGGAFRALGSRLRGRASPATGRAGAGSPWCGAGRRATP